jgi:hypothetical protein
VIAGEYVRLTGPQTFITENGVSVPPAHHVIDETGAMWTLGNEYVRPGQGAPCGEFAFNVLRDGVDLDEMASRIEYARGRVRIFTVTGWKRWSGTRFI